MNERIGIIDIGSNSIRLVVYEQLSSGAYRVIDESKESARLSDKIDADGFMSEAAVKGVIDTLLHFRMLCRTHQVHRLRTVATAAVRNAANSADILARIQTETGLPIEILSGQGEAWYGFLGMANTIDIQHGFLIDIGGGSTEVSYFRNRGLLHSISFPFGAVNTSKAFSRGGNVTDADLAAIRSMVLKAAENESWLRAHPGLTLVGLGGTIRNVAKIDQKAKRYSLQHAHNYVLSPADVNQLLDQLASLSIDQRKKVDGLSKERADIIVPGMVIMKTLFELIGASHYLISGAGLRDGLFHEALHPEQPILSDVLEYSVRNLLLLHPSVPVKHVEQVNRLTTHIFNDLMNVHELEPRAKTYLSAASLLYRIGISVNYYDYYKHTFYLIAHSRINGLSHREVLLCALIASFKTAKKTRQMFQNYRDILSESDYHMILKLGSMLQLGVALDRSETQPVEHVQASIHGRELELQLNCSHSPSIELRELQALEKDFAKMWGLKLKPVLKSN
ncbi:Ppx/GppA phosphatase family protein [Paenibacillus turpanensis]|uniref:Ppx/GppA phosphatase family protein n=1 Tax=Paenibacillus turpanensis TaxID=2689078 RepID=UPI00140D2019|nr:Ppx/GppA phosphatase family protein [Paenibacillus turpanensis]